MKKNLTFHKKKVWTIFLLCAVMMLGLAGRLVYLMGVRADYYSEKAQELHERERPIKAARGKIVDAKGKVLASNKIVCTVSVIHSQIKEPEKIISLLSQKLELSEDTVRKKVEKISSIERIRTNVEKKVGDEIRKVGLAGVKVDEDYKRYYPWKSLASRVLGFTGADNQGIIGLEVEYEDVLSGDSGKILTTTDARGIELDGVGENRKEPKTGSTLRTSLDISIQEYVQQAALKVMEEKDAERVSMGMEVDMNKLFGTLYNKAMEGDPDCGGLLSYCYFSGEHMTGFEEGRPLFVRSPESKFTLANFMRTNLYTCLGAMRVGLNILIDQEHVKIERLLGHGGLFKTKGVGQQILADAVNAPVSVMSTAGEGGAWGIALLAAYLVDKKDGETLDEFLDNRVFAGNEGSTLDPEPEGVQGFNEFMDRYLKGLPVERAAVESDIW